MGLTQSESKPCGRARLASTGVPSRHICLDSRGVLGSPPHPIEDSLMSVAKVTEITSTSTKSFEDAIAAGLARPGTNLRNVKGAWVANQKVEIDNGKITTYRVDLKVTFVL